jgi:hypothetical protein
MHQNCTCCRRATYAIHSFPLSPIHPRILHLPVESRRQDLTPQPLSHPSALSTTKCSNLAPVFGPLNELQILQELITLTNLVALST